MSGLAARFVGLCLLATLALSGGLAAAEEPPDLTIRDVVTQFPICLLPSSMGQRCKTVPDETRPTRTPMNQIAFVALTVEGDEASFTEDDWYYTYAVSPAEMGAKGDWVIHFTDDGILGSYHVAQDFHVAWDPDLAVWTVIGSTLKYISGPDEQHRIGAFEPLVTPIPFVQ